MEKQLKDVWKNNIFSILLLFWTEFLEKQCLLLILLLKTPNKSLARKIIKTQRNKT